MRLYCHIPDYEFDLINGTVTAKIGENSVKMDSKSHTVYLKHDGNYSAQQFGTSMQSAEAFDRLTKQLKDENNEDL